MQQHDIVGGFTDRIVKIDIKPRFRIEITGAVCRFHCDDDFLQESLVRGRCP